MKRAGKPAGKAAGSARSRQAASEQEVLRQRMVATLVHMAVMLATVNPARNHSFDAGEDGIDMVGLAIRGLCAALAMQELVLTQGDVELVERFTSRREVHERATKATSIH